MLEKLETCFITKSSETRFKVLKNGYITRQLILCQILYVFSIIDTVILVKYYVMILTDILLQVSEISIIKSSNYQNAYSGCLAFNVAAKPRHNRRIGSYKIISAVNYCEENMTIIFLVFQETINFQSKQKFCA